MKTLQDTPDQRTTNAVKPATILIVDDVADNLAVLGALLQPAYTVLAAPTGERALEIASQQPQPDLILLDVMMPGLDGYEVLRRLRKDPLTRHIPIIFLTALDDARDEEFGLTLGAADYITKPIRPAVVLTRVGNQIEVIRAHRLLRDQNLALEEEVARRMAENDRTQLVTIRALAHLAEARDPETGNHILRTQAYVHLLPTRLQTLPAYADLLDDRYIELLARSAPLHDIGKVGIPDHILLKPGRLDADEWAVMMTHAKLGAEAIELAEQERAEAEIIRDFMPRQLCEDDTRKAVAEVIGDLKAEGLRDMGRCMAALKERYPGQMDFAKANGIAKSILQ